MVDSNNKNQQTEQLWRTFSAAANVKAYVFRIVHNIAVDHIARSMRHKTALYAPDEIAELNRDSENANNQCPTEKLGQQQRQAALLRAVRALTPPYRQVIVLMLEDFSSPEIADILQISAGAVRVRINRAKAELKERLNHAH